jgi:hypothetical protein
MSQQTSHLRCGQLAATEHISGEFFPLIPAAPTRLQRDKVHKSICSPLFPHFPVLDRDPVWPGYPNRRNESWLERGSEAWENQMKTDAENARSLSVFARGGCRMDELAPAASDRVPARGESSVAGAAGRTSSAVQ